MHCDSACRRNQSTVRPSLLLAHTMPCYAVLCHPVPCRASVCVLLLLT